MAGEDQGILDEIEDPTDEATEQDTGDETVDDDLAEGAEDDGETADDDAEADEEESPTSDDSDAESGDAGKPKGVKSRIDKLVREREDARREAEHYRRLAEEKATPPKKEEPPKQDDFESYEDYISALTAYNTRLETRKILDEERARTQAAERDRQVAERFESARKRFADFDEVVNNGRAAEHVIDIIGESELVAELAYHLGKNPETARKLSAMTPTAAAREIGKIEARIHDRLKLERPPGKNGNATPAIKPTKTLGGGSGSPTKDPEKMPMDEYIKWREEGGGT